MGVGKPTSGCSTQLQTPSRTDAYQSLRSTAYLREVFQADADGRNQFVCTVLFAPR
jgi:hypothetical protein